MLDPKSILHINVSRIGDTLLATPIIRALARAWPNANITCLGHPKRVELLQHLPFVAQVDKITKNRAPWMGRLPGRKQYDLAVVHGFDEALIWYALRVADKVSAFRQADEALNRQLYRCTARPVLDTIHAVDIQLPLIHCLDIQPDGRHLSYHISAEEQASAKQRLRHARVDSQKPLIGIVLESFPTKPYRDWPIGHFIDVTRGLLRHHPHAQFILLGGKVTPEKIQAMRNSLGHRVTVFAGQLSLRESAAVIGELDLYLGVDTGPTHLAGALGIPMVALYHCLHRGYILAPLDRPDLEVVEHPATDAEASSQLSMADIAVATVRQSMLKLLAQKHG